MNRIMKKLVPGVLAAALALGAVPSGITVDDIKADAAVPVNRMVKYMGGSVGTQVYAKLIFHVDTDNPDTDEVETNDAEVVAIRIHDPDEEAGTYKVIQRSNWTPYEGKGAVYGDYEVTVPVFPKNMHNNISFEMLDSENNALYFYPNLNTNVYNFNVNQYLNNIKKNISDDYGNIKSDANDEDKALWDLCNALINYGAWSKFYFYKQDEPSDGAYVAYPIETGYDENTEGKHPKYPTWWTNKIPVKNGEDITYNDYWQYSKNKMDFNDYLTKYNSICNVTYQEHLAGRDTLLKVDDTGSSYGSYHSYHISLVLDDFVRIRVRVNGAGSTNATVFSDEDQEKKSIKVLKQISSSSHQYQNMYSCVIDSEEISFAKLDNKHYFEVSDVCPKLNSIKTEYVYTDSDKVSVNVLGYARIMHQMRTSYLGYEESGIANAIRALVTVSVAENNYIHVNDEPESTESTNA